MRYLNLIAGCSLVLVAACRTGGAGNGDVAIEPEADTAVAEPAGRDMGRDMGGGVAQADGDFVRQAAMSSLAEIRLGELADERASHAEVKQFAQRLIDDHTRASNDLKQAVGAGQAGAADQAQFPTELDPEHRQIEQRLSSESGANFDRAYLTVLVEQHRKAEQLLQQRTQAAGEAAEGGDEITQWAQKTLPIIRDHLQRATELQQRVRQEQPQGQPQGQPTPY